LRTLSFLSNRKVPAIEGRHDIENNLQLLAPFGIDPGQADPKPLFVLNRESRDCVSRWLATEAIPDGIRLVGIHAGAGPLGDRKKWGLNNFTREIRNVLTQDPTAHIIIFGGKEEANEKAELAELTASANIHIFSGSLMETAACIERCHFFVSNDTGLMHIAAVYGIPQKAIFISTSISRTRPWNDNAEVLDLTHGADYSYPFRSCKP
ncbi:MAG: glycosyltransferase family 9 protein, partial [Rhodospirillales bacterium]|nr:glycosyltransferase family 9 protein [Rhodospirillales bacterium]